MKKGRLIKKTTASAFSVLHGFHSMPEEKKT